MKQIPIIIKARFATFLFFNRTIIPSPELTNNPAKSAPKERDPSAKSLVISKLLAQLGIRPMMEANNGVRYLLLFKNPTNLSSPMNPIINPITKLITSTYAKTSRE